MSISTVLASALTVRRHRVGENLDLKGVTEMVEREKEKESSGFVGKKMGFT